MNLTGKPYIGLTFRERLIVALASNATLIENKWDDDGMPMLNTAKDALRRNAESVINQADIIIKQLNEEKK